MKLGIIKRTIVKSGIGIARMIVTPEFVMEEAQNILTGIAAKAHSGDRTRAIIERGKNALAAMEDGVVNVEETRLLLGDLVTKENIDKVFDYLGKKVS